MFFAGFQLVDFIGESRFNAFYLKAHFLHAVQDDLTVHHREIPDDQVIFLVAVCQQQIALIRIKVQTVIVEILFSCVRDVPAA